LHFHYSTNPIIAVLNPTNQIIANCYIRPIKSLLFLNSTSQVIAVSKFKSINSLL